MLPGYNHNIDYKQQVFHVQTEDSGLNSPFITTQVFLGGSIINSLRTSYSDLLELDPAPDMIRKRMQDQHKQSLKALLAGEFDDVIVQRTPEKPQNPSVPSEEVDPAPRPTMEPSTETDDLSATDAEPPLIFVPTVHPEVSEEDLREALAHFLTPTPDPDSPSGCSPEPTAV